MFDISVPADGWPLHPRTERSASSAFPSTPWMTRALAADPLVRLAAAVTQGLAGLTCSTPLLQWPGLTVDPELLPFEGSWLGRVRPESLDG
jgi:hypothetical protein